MSNQGFYDPFSHVARFEPYFLKFLDAIFAPSNPYFRLGKWIVSILILGLADNLFFEFLPLIKAFIADALGLDLPENQSSNLQIAIVFVLGFIGTTCLVIGSKKTRYFPLSCLTLRPADDFRNHFYIEEGGGRPGKGEANGPFLLRFRLEIRVGHQPVKIEDVQLRYRDSRGKLCSCVPETRSVRDLSTTTVETQNVLNSGDVANLKVGDRVVLNVRHRCYPNKLSEYPEDCDLGEIEICLFYSTAPTHNRRLRQLNYRLDGYEVKRVFRLSDVLLPFTQKPASHWG